MKSKTTSAITFKILFSRLLCCLIIFTSIIMNAGAQVVNANLIITPPYSVYFRDYSGYGKTNNMLLSVNSTTNRKVYLAGSVTKDDNSIVISVKDKYRPLVPIFITANVPLMQNGLQLRNIFGNGTTDDLNLTGLTANDIGLNQALPEGSYTFCIKVKDYDTREVISTACKTIFVTYSDPPQIINPFNGSAVTGFNPQMLMVTWQNTAPAVFGITYRLKMVKLEKGITPLDALNNNVLLLLNKPNLTTTNYPLDVASGIKLETGQTYAMQVIAQSPTAFFKNAGKSEVTTFFYKGANPVIKLGFLNPVAEKGKDTIKVNNDDPFSLSWSLYKDGQQEDAKKYGITRFHIKLTPALNPSAKKPTDKDFTPFETATLPNSTNELTSTLAYKREIAEKTMGLKNGYWYNATITAYDKSNKVIVKNSSVDFLYKKNFNLAFLNPIAEKGLDKIEVNNEKPLMISWNVFEGDLASKSNIVLDASTGKKYDIVKYVINITPALSVSARKLSDKNFSYSTSTVAVNESLSSAIAISEANADKAGFKDNYWYNVTVKGYDKNNEEVVKNSSVDFQYSKIKDNEIYVNTTARAVIKYAFQGFPEIYNAANTPVQVEVLQKKPTFSMNSDDPPRSKRVIQIGDVSYYTLGRFSASTQKNGEVEVKLKIPVNDISKDDIYYRLILNGPYYIDKAFKLLSAKAPVKDKVSNKDTSIINFGQLVAQTYGYSLKVNVSKAYPSYSISNSTGKITLSDYKFDPKATKEEYVTTPEGITYKVAKTKAVAGITIALYRKDKKSYVPPVEGKLAPADAAEYGFVEVARAKTTIAKDDNGNDISFVKFDKLLSNLYSGDEYFIVALKDNESIPGQSKTIFLQTGSGSSSSYSFTNPYAGLVYKEAEFVATEKMYELKLPTNFNQPDALYRNVSVDYNITSTMPPTSLIKGRLQYAWKSDESNKIRPMAKTRFDVIVDYLVNGKSISAIYGKNNNKDKMTSADGITDITKEYITFGTEYDKIQLLDYGKVMGSGITDDQGNFELEVVNLNKKGDIGIGQYSGKIPDQVPGYKPREAPKTYHILPGTKPADIMKAIQKMRIKNQELNPEEQSNFSKLKEQLTGNFLEGLTSNKLEELMNGLTQNGLLQGNIVEGLLNGIRQGGLPVSEPVDQFSSNDNGAGIDVIEGILDNTTALQAAVNTGMVTEDQEDGSVNITKISSSVGKTGVNTEKVTEKTKVTNTYRRGPNENLSNENEDLGERGFEGDHFIRVYRIVPRNDNFYPTKETFEVQPFEASAFKPFTSFVKEVTVTVFAKDLNDKKLLKDVLITVFRSTKDKTKDLPAGEGDGKYLQKELVNPQYKDKISEMLQETKLDINNIFTTKFEFLSPSQIVGETGAKFTTLLSNFNNYYIQASSDPAKSGSYYTATISAITPEKYDDPDFWDGTKQPKALANITMLLKPLESRAFLRLIDNKTQSSIARGEIKVSNVGSAVKTRTVIADDDGFAEIKVSDPALKKYLPLQPPGKETKIGFAGEANGYKPSEVLDFTFKSSGQEFTGQQFSRPILLDPAGSMKGRLVSVDESKIGIEGYIITPSGKVYTTKKDGTFEIPIPAITNDKIKIIPKDVAYFDTAYTIKSSDAYRALINLNDISIYRRKHRIRFVVTNENGRKVENAIITSGKMSPLPGTTDFIFENVSVNNYTFVIRGKNGSNYIPITKNVKNEETKDFVTVNVTLENGSEITGSVNMDGKPVKNAKVYIDADAKEQPAANNGKPSGEITDDANLIQAFTDAEGKYTLHGVPVNNQKIDLLATLDTNFTVSGDRKKANIVNKKATTDFTLTAYKNFVITNLHGFPLTVEKIQLVGDELSVSGLVHWTKSISNFSLNEINEVIRVEDVRYKLLPALLGNKRIASAIENKITLEGSPVLKLKYLDKYNVKLTASSDPFDMDPLFISKEGDYGVIKGMIQIVDNSFNYPSSYLSFNNPQYDENNPTKGEKYTNFFFAQKEEGKITNVLSAVKSAVTISDAASGNYPDEKAFSDMVNKIYGKKSNSNNDKPDYYLSNAAGQNINFKFIEFNAQADAENSFIDKNGKIHLNITLDCEIKNSQPEKFKVNLKDVVLDNNKVYAASSQSPIEVKLEEWTLSVKDWKLSPEQGGITSSNGLIKTAKVDIPFSTFVLRSDMFNFADFDASKLQMGGGIVTLNVDPTAAEKANVLWDNNTGSGQGHWRFSLSSIGTPVATINGLEGLTGEIGIDYIHILSDNSNVFQFMQSKIPLLIRNNSLAKFYPQFISNGPGYFKITGGLNVGAPRMGDMLLELSYTLQNNGKVTMKPSNVLTDFEGKGFVHFVTLAEDKNQTGKEPNITITENEIKIRGEVIEKPSKTFTPIPANFIATASNNAYKVDLTAPYVMQLTSDEKSSPAPDGYKLKIDSGGMAVNNGDWGTLSYRGEMTSNSVGGIKPTVVTFTVLGDISADAKEVKMDNIETPFGKMQMVFDFASKELKGKLEVNEVYLGPNKITGAVETLFGPKGFYVAGGGTAEVNVGNPIVNGTYNLGFMIGKYTVDPLGSLWKTVTAYKQPEIKNNCFVTHQIKGDLAGVYLSVDRILFDKEYDFDFVIASGYVKGKALVGVDMWVNFAGGANFGLGLKAFVHAAAGMSAITGTSLSGDVRALASLVAKYSPGATSKSPGSTSIIGTIDMSFSATIKQDLLVTDVSATKTVGCRAEAGTNGFSFELNKGDCPLDCDGKPVCPK
ncbi:MAG: hypothetical protein WKF91_00300 [Segetibacter sp.]